jgi:antitoxin CptB
LSDAIDRSVCEPVRRDLARLRWRCRRGMRELDALLTGYFERGYPRAVAAERDAFARLLELPDPELFGYLVGRAETAEEPLRDVIARIRNPVY